MNWKLDPPALYPGAPMIYSSGFILAQERRSRVIGLSIRGFPPSGYFLSPRYPPMAFSIVEGSSRSSDYNPVLGQGELRIAQLDFEKSSPELATIDLELGFLCYAERSDLKAVEQSCIISFIDCSLYPFVFSPSPYQGGARTESPFELEMKQTYLQTGCWYPIELYSNGIETGLGVINLTECDNNTKAGTGRLLIICAASYDLPQSGLSLRRHGRCIGALQLPRPQ